MTTLPIRPLRIPLLLLTSVTVGACAAEPIDDLDEDALGLTDGDFVDVDVDPPTDELQTDRSIETTWCRTVSDCDQDNVCAAAQCLENKCIYTPVSGPCDDGNACTLEDTCVAGVCKGTDEVMLLSGGTLPAAEGWNLYGDPAASTNGTVVNVDTTTISQLYRYSTYGQPISSSVFDTHDLEWRLTVHYADHNPFDASVVVFPSFTGWYGWGPTQRRQMIYFEEDRIGWGDEASSYLVNAATEHAYRLHVTPNGDAEVYVDNQLALTRSNITIGPMVGFGDQTNDWGVDGDFDIRGMRLIPHAGCKAR